MTMEPRLHVIPDADWIEHLASRGITPESVVYWHAAHKAEAHIEESFHDYIMRVASELSDEHSIPIPLGRISRGIHKWAHGVNPSDEAAPRAFYDGLGTIYCKSSATHDERLLQHEYAHAIGYADHDHPTSILAGILHALRVGFDVRAFTGLLRWRPAPPELQRRYDMWVVMLNAT